jgi:four helix bundle protein
MQNFRNLRVYQQAYILVPAVYAATRELPTAERFGLTGQMRRASVSIVSNIAEGAGRGGTDFSRFLRMALGSAFELETQLRLCSDLHLIGPSDVDLIVEQVDEVQKKLGALIAAIGNSSEPRT